MAKLLSADLPSDLDLVVLFGSRAQGTATSSSDWDLGVRFSPGQGDPLRLYRLDVELATRLGCSSDTVVVVEHGQPFSSGNPASLAAFAPEPFASGPIGNGASRSSPRSAARCWHELPGASRCCEQAAALTRAGEPAP